MKHIGRITPTQPLPLHVTNSRAYAGERHEAQHPMEAFEDISELPENPLQVRFRTPPVPGAWMHDVNRNPVEGVRRDGVWPEMSYVTDTRSGPVTLAHGDWLSRDGDKFQVHKNLID